MARVARRVSRRRATAGLVLVLCLGATLGCSGLHRPSPVPCSRANLEPAPPWTVSVSWHREGESLLLVDPGRRALVIYGRDGERRREVSLDGVAELDFAFPMRLEREGDGYLLIDRGQILRFGVDLSFEGSEPLFAALEARGLLNGSFNDVLLRRDQLYGWVDLIDTTRKPEDDPDSEGTWRRGFVRLDPRRTELAFVEELSLEDGGEYASYYLYDRRPYVAVLGGEVYVLRFAEPWRLERFARGGLREVAIGAPAEDEEIWGLYPWEERLYVLSSRRIREAGTPEPTEPVLEELPAESRAAILHARAAALPGRTEWSLEEVDPRRGERLRRLRLPSAAERLRLVPGESFWIAIEEGTAPNVGQESKRTGLLFLPAEEVAAGVFTCPEG